MIKKCYQQNDKNYVNHKYFNNDDDNTFVNTPQTTI